MDEDLSLQNGFYRVRTDRYLDHRGGLSVIEHATRNGFVAERTFLIDFADGAVRARHVTSCSEILMTLRGAIRIEVDGGNGTCAATAREADGAFFVAAGAWRELVALEAGSRMLVLADQPFSETYHPDGIEPEMIAAALRRYPA